jgi:hypothetical protein
MSPAVIIGIVGVVVIGLLGVGLKIVGERYVAKVEEVGDLKVKVAERDGVIKQKEGDAALSDKLVTFERMLNERFALATAPAREIIVNVSDDKTCKNDPALEAASSGVVSVRNASAAARRDAQQNAGRRTAPAVR